MLLMGHWCCVGTYLHLYLETGKQYNEDQGCVATNQF